MTAAECDCCGESWAYDRIRCPACGGESFSSVKLGRGELIAMTISHVTPPGVREPNPLGVVLFGDVALTVQLADEELKVGDSVVLGGNYELRDGFHGPRIEPL